MNRKLTNFITFLVAKCLARLTGLVSDHGVEFSPVRNGLMYCTSFGLIGICFNQQEALALPGKDLGTHSRFSVRFGPAPRISRLGSVNHGGGDSGNSCDEGTDFVCKSLIQPLLKSDGHRDRLCQSTRATEPSS